METEKEPNVVVTASIGISFWNKAKLLQKQGVEAASWSNAMRRGLRIAFDCAEGKGDIVSEVERLRERVKETIRENLELKERLDKNVAME